jgi:hypothetical protein
VALVTQALLEQVVPEYLESDRLLVEAKPPTPIMNPYAAADAFV